MTENILSIISKRAAERNKSFTLDNDKLIHCLNGFSTLRNLEVESSKVLVGGLDITHKKIDGIPTHFSLGIGSTSLFYLNDSRYADKIVIKSKLLTEIVDSKRLNETLGRFIFYRPKPQEIIDVSPKAREEKMQRCRENKILLADWMEQH